MKPLIFISISIKNGVLTLYPTKMDNKELPRAAQQSTNSVTSGTAELVPVINGTRQTNGVQCFLGERWSPPPVSTHLSSERRRGDCLTRFPQQLTGYAK